MITAPPSELVARWRTRAPRYTSYPSSPHFGPLPEGALARACAGAGPLSVYVHLPFCTSLCHYCGCHVEIQGRKELGTVYVDTVLAEARLWASRMAPRTVRQLALGGGTPTWILPEDMERLVQGLRAIWPFEADADVATEVDPRSVDAAYLDRLVAVGFNRYSFGVQDFDPVVLKAVHRVQPPELTERAVARLRTHGDADLNFDLVYGLPEQTPQRFHETLERVVALRPTRVAIFHYAHVPWMKPAQKVLERFRFPDSDEKMAMMLDAHATLGAAGWHAIGLDHFAREGDQLLAAFRDGTLQRNFEGYTTHAGLDQVGLGVSAIGDLNGVYVGTIKDRAPWTEHIRAGRLPVDRGFVRSPDDELRRRVIMTLFCTLHAHLADDERAQLAASVDQLGPLQADGLVTVDGGDIRVTELGRHFVRNVCAVFDRYLEADAGQRRYSQTA